MLRCTIYKNLGELLHSRLLHILDDIVVFVAIGWLIHTNEFWERHIGAHTYDILVVQGYRGAIGVDGVQLGQIASRGAGGLVNTGKKTNAKNNFATARNASCVLA